MMKTFADKRTEDLLVQGSGKRVAPDVVSRAVRKLEYVDLARCLDDLRTPPGNRLHALRGDERDSMHLCERSMARVLCFVDGDAYDVEVCDYH